MITTIIFDLDGTLYPEKDFAESGFKAVSAYLSGKYGTSREKIFAILRKDFNAGMRGKNFDRLLEKLNIDENVVRLVKVYKNHHPQIELPKDAGEFLKKMEENMKLGLLTNGDKKTQANKIEALKLKKYFKAILVCDDFGEDNWRKSQKSFAYLLKKLKSAAEETVYVGDNPLRDFMGAKKLGIATVRIKRKNGEYNNVAARPGNVADYEINSLSKLEKVIKNNGKKD